MGLDALSGQFVLLGGRLSNTFHFGFEAGNKVRGSDYYLMKGVRAQQNCRLTKVWNECFESCPKSTSCIYLWCSKEQKVQKKTRGRVDVHLSDYLATKSDLMWKEQPSTWARRQIYGENFEDAFLSFHFSPFQFQR